MGRSVNLLEEECECVGWSVGVRAGECGCTDGRVWAVECEFVGERV